MKKSIIILTIISSFNISCHTVLLKHRDYMITLADLDWHKKIEGQVGEIYIKGSDILYGRNFDSTFIEISTVNGDLADTLHPYTIPKERACLILDSTREFENGYSLYTIPVNKNRISKVSLKVSDRQYRGDMETFSLIVKTLAGDEFTLLFNPGQFTSVLDILYFEDGRFVMSYNRESAGNDHAYFNCIGLFDLDKILKNKSVMVSK